MHATQYFHASRKCRYNFSVPKLKNDNNQNKSILASRALSKLGNVFIQLFEEQAVSDELKASMKNYMDISNNLNNCVNSLKSATKISKLNINYKSPYDYDKEFEANNLLETLESYARFIMIENDFANLTLCAETILKDVEKTFFNQLPSLSELELTMDEISVHGRRFVETVNLVVIKTLCKNLINFDFSRVLTMQDFY